MLDRAKLMAARDAVNGSWGKGAMMLASGKVGAVPRNWSMKQGRRGSSLSHRFKVVFPV